MVSEAAVDTAGPRSLALDGRRRPATPAWWALCAFVASIPFSIVIAETLLVIAAVAAIADARAGRVTFRRTPLDLPILAFALSGLLGAIVGLSFWESFWGLRTYLQVVIVYLVLAYADEPDRARTLMVSYLGGSAVTAAYTVLGAIAPTWFPRLFLGSMTQSGQLQFAIGFALALMLVRGQAPRWLPIAFPLYVLALIANLKRGAWLGVLACIAVTAASTSRRVIVIAALVAALAVTAAPPVRERLANSARDLSLPGNRFDIWHAAVDVIERFPMGVGRKNGEILRDYPNIPQRHKHAHDNLLQITLENGFLGLAAYLWWMGAFAVLAFRAWRADPRDATYRAVSIAVLATLVGFQVAGLVEYNFGDSEVLEAFFLTMGLGLVASEKTREEA